MTLEEAIAHCKEKAEELRKEADDCKEIYKEQCEKPNYKSYISNCLECSREHEQLAEWLTKLDEARKIIWDTSLEDACKIMKLRNLIDYDLGKRVTNDKTD